MVHGPKRLRTAGLGLLKIARDRGDQV